MGSKKPSLLKRLGLFFSRIREQNARRKEQKQASKKGKRKITLYRRVKKEKAHKAEEYTSDDKITLTQSDIDLLRENLDDLAKLDDGELITIHVREKGTKSDINKAIRYKILREAGYSAKQASKLRSRNYIPINEVEELKFSKDTIFKNKYDKTVDYYTQAHRVKYFKSIVNDTVYSQHGYLSNSHINKDKKLSEEYYKYVVSLMQRYDLTEQQAWIMAYYQIESNEDSEKVARDLLMNADYEISISPRKKRKAR